MDEPRKPRDNNPPDFAIIGMMKSGTTSLYSWLRTHSDVFLPLVKEPDFFSKEWRRGADWYGRLFADALPHQIRGDGSVSYSYPEFADVAAARLIAASPGLKIVCLLRNPIERTRSHYRHQVLRGRESRPFREAVLQSDSEYVSKSLYWTCLAPYIKLLPRENILVVRSEDMFGPSSSSWFELLGFLAVPPVERPREHLNAADGKRQFTRAMHLLWEAGLRRAPRGTPAVLRGLAKRSLLKAHADPLFDTSTDAVDASVSSVIWEDCDRLSRWLATDQPLWSKSDAPQAI